ncbi:hypothetical protein HK098_001274 [Nowakowskiella sp. JEL0407]|nr:hypothetical protein HK098_001274 [Nowakowskiella sp. JEL0407]
MDSNTSVDHALKILSENHIHAAPVYDKESRKWLGSVDVLDIVFLALNMATNGIDIEHHMTKMSITEPGITQSTNINGINIPVSKEVVDSWKEWCASNDPEVLNHRGVRFGLKPVKHAINESGLNRFSPVYENGTLFQVVEELFCEGIHRVPVMSYKDEEIIDFISQSDVVNLLANSISSLGSVSSKTVQDLGIISDTVIAMSLKAQAIHAFWLMKFHHVNGIAVTGGSEGSMLVGNISASDLKHLEDHKFSSLLQPISHFLAESNEQKEARKFDKPPVVVTKKTTFGNLLQKMSIYKVHRVYVVDEECVEVIGVITMTQIMNLLIR